MIHLIDLNVNIPNSKLNTKPTQVASVDIGRIGEKTPTYPPKLVNAVVASAGKPVLAGSKSISQKSREYAIMMMAVIIMLVYVDHVNV